MWVWSRPLWIALLLCGWHGVWASGESADSTYCALQTRLEIAIDLQAKKQNLAAWDTLNAYLDRFEGQSGLAFERLRGEYHFWLGSAAFYMSDDAACGQHLHLADSLIFGIDGQPSAMRARVRRMQGSKAYFLEGNPFKAQKLYNASYQEWHAVPSKDSSEYAVVLQCMGQAAGRLGEYEKSVDLYQQSLEIRKLVFGEHHWRVGWSYWNLGNTHFYAFQYEAARTAFEQALEILKVETPDDINTIGNISNNLALTYQYLEEYDLSIQKHLESIGFRTKHRGEMDPELAIQLSNLAMVYAQKRNFSNADAALARARKICVENGLRTGRLIAWIKIEEAAIKIRKGGTIDEGLFLAHEAMCAIAPKTPSTDILSFPSEYETNEPVLLQEIALFYGEVLSESRDRNLLEASLSAYQLAGRLSDRLRMQYEDNDDKLALSDRGTPFLRNSLLVANKLWELTHDGRYVAIAYELMERNKFQLLLEFFKRSQVQVAGELEEPELKKLDSLQTRCTELDYLLSLPQLPPDSQQALRAELLEKRQSLREFKDSLERRSLLFRTVQREQSTVSLPMFQQAVHDPGLATIAYALTDSNLFVVMTLGEEKGLRAATLPPGFHDSLRVWIDLCRQPATEPGDYKRFVQNGHSIFQTLIAPELTRIGNRTQRLLIIPDGVLGNLPFEALISEAPTSDRVNYGNLAYLIKRYQFQYGASGSLWASQRTRPRTETQPLECFGIAWGQGANVSRGPASAASPPPLPGTETEIAMIRSMVQGRYLVGTEASEAAFKQFAPQFGLLHLALHARATHEPEILFPVGGAEGEDGTLHFHELFHMHLKARLAVLSACETAKGDVKKGEGIQSMSSGFAAAGIPSLLVSLWEVDDRTGSMVMESFYRGMGEGMPLDASLRAAKLDFLEQAEGYEAAPYYWSAFVPLGDMSPVALQPSSGSPWIAILAGACIGLCILLVFSIYKKKRKSS